MVAVTAVSCALLPLPSAAQAVEDVVLRYRTTDEDSGRVVDLATITMVPGDSAGWSVEWRSQAKPRNAEDIQLDSSLATRSWRVRYAEEGYDYAGQRVGDVLRIEGILDGSEIHKDVEIDERPFYYNWRLGLIDFVLSGEEKRGFWTFRPDNQSAYPFEAQRKEEAVMMVDGRSEQVVRVEWGLSGWRRSFYKGSQWHRTSDGLLVSERRDDQLVELVSSSGGPGR